MEVDRKEGNLEGSHFRVTFAVEGPLSEIGGWGYWALKQLIDVHFIA